MAVPDLSRVRVPPAPFYCEGMMQTSFVVETTKSQEIFEITAHVQSHIRKALDGTCTIYIPHTTAGVFINEHTDPNIWKDILKALEENVPTRNNWKHDQVDGNAHAHIKATIIGTSVTIPVKHGTLQLGTWQGIMFCEFDGPRKRVIIIQTMEE